MNQLLDSNIFRLYYKKKWNNLWHVKNNKYLSVLFNDVLIDFYLNNFFKFSIKSFLRKWSNSFGKRFSKKLLFNLNLWLDRLYIDKVLIERGHQIKINVIFFNILNQNINLNFKKDKKEKRTQNTFILRSDRFPSKAKHSLVRPKFLSNINLVENNNLFKEIVSNNPTVVLNKDQLKVEEIISKINIIDTKQRLQLFSLFNKNFVFSNDLLAAFFFFKKYSSIITKKNKLKKSTFNFYKKLYLEKKTKLWSNSFMLFFFKNIIQRDLSKILGKEKFLLNFSLNQNLAPSMVGKYIAKYLKQRMTLNRIIFSFLRSIPKAYPNISGILIKCKGRITKKPRAGVKWFRLGTIYRNDVKSNLDFSEQTVFLKFGAVSIKVWIYYKD